MKSLIYRLVSVDLVSQKFTFSNRSLELLIRIGQTKMRIDIHGFESISLHSLRQNIINNKIALAKKPSCHLLLRCTFRRYLI